MVEHDRIEKELPPHTSAGADTKPALLGVRVIDFSHFVAGPLASMLLGDMGAEIIKVESPDKGDDFRYYPPIEPGLEMRGAPFMWCNRNKHSITLDLKSAEGIQVARDLIAKADVVLENFSTGVMERLGLGYECCRALKPDLVYCSVSAYGRKGEFADRLGFDPIAQAESGFVSMNGHPDREGVRAGAPVMDIATAMMASNAILGALYARNRTGVGQCVEVAMLSSAIMMLGFSAMQNLLSGIEYQRFGNTSPDTAPSGVFKAKDGRSFYINSGNTKIFQRLFRDVLERPDVASDPHLIGREDRVRRRKELFALLDDIFASQPWDYWRPRLRAAAIPAGEVRSVGQALRSPEVMALNLVSRIPHPTVGWIPNIAPPFCFSETPTVNPVPAPALGEHTLQILQETLGYEPQHIEDLATKGVFGARPPWQQPCDQAVPDLGDMDVIPLMP